MRDRTETEIAKGCIRLVLIRHGECEANKRRAYLGREDAPLSEEGALKIKSAADKGIYPEADRMFISPMLRCRQTASIIYPDLVRSAVAIDDWREIDFGRFEGKTAAELDGDPDYQAFIDTGGRHPFPEGESREDFSKRCYDGYLTMLKILKDALPRTTDDGDIPTVCAVVHGGTIMSLLERLDGGDYYSYQIGTGEGYVCTIAPDREPEDSLNILWKINC